MSPPVKLQYVTPEENLSSLTDELSRPLRDLRISVTDRCNFRCTYCMPKEIFGRNYKFMQQGQLLSFKEITRLAQILVSEHGVKKIRLTGGEPLLRDGLELLIEKLSAIPGVSLALTTNGALLKQKAQLLRDAGLQQITVSLDSLDNTVFKKITDQNIRVDQVLTGIEAASEAGFESIKINMVVKRGVNDQSILPMAEYFRGSGHILRFIEYMDVGNANGWQLEDVVPAEEIIEEIARNIPLVAIEPNYRGEVATRWQYQDGSGEIGVIASVTQPFCSDCSRLRLSAKGSIYTCLFASQGFSLLELLRGNASDAKVSKTIASIWRSRSDRYSEERSVQTFGNHKVEMSYIGG